MNKLFIGAVATAAIATSAHATGIAVDGVLDGAYVHTATVAYDPGAPEGNFDGGKSSRRQRLHP